MARKFRGIRWMSCAFFPRADRGSPARKERCLQCFIVAIVKDVDKWGQEFEPSGARTLAKASVLAPLQQQDLRQLAPHRVVDPDPECGDPRLDRRTGQRRQVLHPVIARHRRRERRRRFSRRMKMISLTPSGRYGDRRRPAPRPCTAPRRSGNIVVDDDAGATRAPPQITRPRSLKGEQRAHPTSPA